MFAENLFPLAPFIARERIWRPGKKRRAKISFTIIPHYIILYIIQKPTNFSFPREEEGKSSTKRDERKFAATIFLSLLFPQKLLLGIRTRRNNQNCMWFVISLVFVKVTNSISARKTGKPEKLKAKFFLTSFSLALCLLCGLKAVDENKSEKLLLSPQIPVNLHRNFT